tara:strand:- start:1248 stop:4007 length:2760 start_codon:yes stop_codon:yes gene_type:complete
MASINCNIVNPHYKELLDTIDNWSKSNLSRKQMNNPYEAAFRLAERDFLVELDTLKYDTNSEILTKGRLNGFKKTLKTLNQNIKSGRLDGQFAQYFYQTSHYGAKDPVIGGYLKDMQNSSFFFRKNELRDRNRFKEIITSLQKDAGINSMLGKLGYRAAQKKMTKLDNDLVKAINDGDDAKASEVQKEINKLTTSGELKSFGDFMDVVERGLKEATEAKYNVIKDKANKGDSSSKELLKKIDKGNARVILTDREIANIVKDRNGVALKERPELYKAVVQYDVMMQDLYKSLKSGIDQRINSIIERMKINGDEKSVKELKDVKEKLREQLMPKYKAGYFPHYVRDLSAPFMQKMMPHLDDLQNAANPYIKDKPKTVIEIANQIRLDISEHAKGIAEEADYNYSKHFLNVVDSYISDVNRFNFTSFTDAHFLRSLSGVEKIFKMKGSAQGYGQNIVDYITDLHKASNGDTDISPKTRALMRSLLGFEFISKLGVNPRSAARNFTQRLLDYVEWGPIQISTMNQQLKNMTLKTSKGVEVDSNVFVESALKDAGLLFDEVSPQLLETGLMEPASMFNLRIWNESKGKYEIREKSRLENFANFTSTIAAKTSYLHRKAENSNRKHTFKIGFAQMYKWLKDNPQFAETKKREWGEGFSESKLETSIQQIAQNYAKNMVILNHFDYADYAKSKAFRSKIGRFMFQFQHYSMEFFERNVKILKEAKQDVLAGNLIPNGDARGLEKAYRMAVAYFLAPVIASAITGLNFNNLVEHDSANRINQLATIMTGDDEDIKKAFYGKGPILSTFGGPLASDIIDIGMMLDVVNLDEDSLLTIITGMQEYDLNTQSTDLSKTIRILNGFAGRLIERHIPQINEGRIGWAIQQELGLYPTKEAKEIQKTYKKVRKKVLPQGIERSLRMLEEGELT